MITFEDLEIPGHLQLHYVYQENRQLGLLMVSSSIPEERLAEEFDRHGLHLRSGEVPLSRSVGGAVAPFVQLLRDMADDDLLEAVLAEEEAVAAAEADAARERTYEQEREDLLLLRD